MPSCSAPIVGTRPIDAAAASALADERPQRLRSRTVLTSRLQLSAISVQLQIALRSSYGWAAAADGDSFAPATTRLALGKASVA